MGVCRRGAGVEGWSKLASARLELRLGRGGVGLLRLTWAGMRSLTLG